MRRTIKFRGKRLDNGEWVYGHYYFDCANMHAIILSREEADVDVGVGSGLVDRHNIVDPETVGQFTGLPDKNGKEIYEGDIVKSPNKGTKEVYWSELDCQLAVEGTYLYRMADKEVIDNIHDNPELKSE